MRTIKSLLTLLVLGVMMISVSSKVEAATSVTASNFAELKAAVNDSCAYITLTDDIPATETLILKTSTHINGAGHSISGNGTFCIVYADSTYALSLENLTMSNGNGASGGYVDGKASGGAISSKSSVVAIGCTFINNTAPGDGGAIYAWGSVTLKNCSFDNCSAGQRGGAVLAAGALNVNASKFTNCTAAWFGGALMEHNSGVELTSSTFTNCYTSANGSKGGAVYSGSGNIALTYCIFSGCEAKTVTGSGGAIYSGSGKVTLYDSTIHDCKANQAAVICTDAGDITAVRITEYSNVSGNKGDIFITASGKKDILYSVYTEYALRTYAAAKMATLYIATDITLTKTLYLEKDLTLLAPETGITISGNDTFTLIYSDGYNLSAENITFVHGNGTSGGYVDGAPSGGAICLVNASFTGTNCSFNNNYAPGKGGAIYSKREVSLTECNFNYNSCAQNGGCIYAEGAISVSKCIFKDNSSKNGKGSCVATKTGALTFANNTLKNNLAIGETGNEYYSESGVIVDKSDKLEFVGASLILGGEIGVDFYFAIPQHLIKNAQTYARVRVPDSGSYYYENVPISDFRLTTVEDNTYYCLTVYVTSTEMSQLIKVKFYDEDYPVSDEYEYSVKTYAKKVINGSDYSEALVNICKSIVNYGFYAQKYANEYTYNFPNSFLTEAEKDVSGVSADDVKDFPIQIGGSVEGIKLSGNKMALESGAKIILLFELSEGYQIEDYSFKVQHKPVKLTQKDGYYEYEYDMISSCKFGTYIPFTIVKGDETMTIKIAVLSYISQVLSYKGTEIDSKLVDLVKAMYLYYKGTCEYTGQFLVPEENSEDTICKKAFRMFPYYWLTDEAWSSTLAGLLEDKDTINEVVLFCDAMHSPYMSDSDLNLYTTKIAERTEELKKLGFSVGYNMLQTVGHGDYATDWLDTPTYSTKVGYDGKISVQMPCMRDKTFLSYIAKKYAAYAAKGPEFIWVDDDFRTNDTTVPYGCFCDNCIGEFNSEYGYSYSRDTLVEILNKDNSESHIVRERWCNFTADSYNNVLTTIAQAVKNVNANIEMRLMTVHLPASASTLSDYSRMVSSLGAAAVRTGGGIFNESEPLEIFTKIYGISHQLAQLSEVESRMYECEDFPQTYYKSGYFHILEATASLLMGCNGITFASIAPDSGNDYIMDAIKNYSPVWDEIVAIGDSYKLYGSTALYKENYSINAPANKFFSQKGFSEQWNAMSPFMDGFMSYTPYEENSNITFISGSMVKSLSDEEIKQIFSKGVFIDGEAAFYLSARGYGYLIGTTNVSFIGSQLQERYTSHELNGSVAGTIRYTYSSGCFNFVLKSGAQELGVAESVTGIRLGTTTYVYENSLGGRVCVSGYQTWEYDGTWQKMEQYDKLFDWLAKDKLYAKVQNAQHVVLLYKQPDDRSEFMLMAINAFLDETPENAQVKLEGVYKDRIYYYDQYGTLGEIDQADITFENGFTIINLPHLSAWGFVVLYTDVN